MNEEHLKQKILKLLEEHIEGERLICYDERHTDGFKSGVMHSLVLLNELKQKIKELK